MIERYGIIENFWRADLATHSYARKVPFVAKNFDHLDRRYYNKEYLLQSFNEELPNAQQFKDVLNVSKGSVSWTCVLPNVILPTHKDTFYTLRVEHNVAVEDCFRYLIFLEDWEFGQYVAFQGVDINGWKSGDVWRFDSEDLHYAANASNIPFHSCQVSTFR